MSFSTHYSCFIKIPDSLIKGFIDESRELEFRVIGWRGVKGIRTCSPDVMAIEEVELFVVFLFKVGRNSFCRAVYPFVRLIFVITVNTPWNTGHNNYYCRNYSQASDSAPLSFTYFFRHIIPSQVNRRLDCRLATNHQPRTTNYDPRTTLIYLITYSVRSQ